MIVDFFIRRPVFPGVCSFIILLAVSLAIVGGLLAHALRGLESGAGAAGRRSLGTVVFGGMLLSTFLSLYIVPGLCAIVGELRKRAKETREYRPAPEPEGDEG
jgi:multidrug efflux pump subunit AcrB